MRLGFGRFKEEKFILVLDKARSVRLKQEDETLFFFSFTQLVLLKSPYFIFFFKTNS